MSSYIRPCAAFPDGYLIPDEVVPQLLLDGLIVKDEWSENHADDDYAAVYSPWDDTEMDTVAYDIEQAVRRWIAPWA